MSATVEELQLVSFANRTLENKMEIVSGGKPRPTLNMSTVTMSETGGSIQTEHFDPAMYDQVQWLTGCEKRQCLFCWPCMLFVPDGELNQLGISDLMSMKEYIPTHEKACDHIQAVLSLKVFVMQHLKQKMVPMNDLEKCEAIRKNRETIKIIIDALCSVVVKAQPPRKRMEFPARIKPENCVKVIEMLRYYSTRCVNYAEDAIHLIRTSPAMLNLLVDIISKVAISEVKKETLQSTYASIILSEHSTDSRKFQMSTVLRYIKNGKVCERFLGFTNVQNKNPAVILNHITHLVEEYGLSERFLAYSIDGAVLHQSALKQVVEVLKELYPYLLFTPSYFHTLHYIFQQRLSEFKEYAKFFKTLNAIEVYYQKNSGQWVMFENMMFEYNPQLRNSMCCIKSELIKVVCSGRKYIIELLESVVQKSNKWTADDIAKARGLLQYLKEFQTVFLLKVYSRLFESTKHFDELLKSSSPEKAFDVKLVYGILKSLELERSVGFERVWDSVIEECVDYDAEKYKKLKMDYSSKERSSRKLFNIIIDHVTNEIKLRFNSAYLLQFCCMLDSESRSKELKHKYYVEKLMEVQGPFFDSEHLQNELIVLQTNGSTFSEKSVHDLLEYFNDSRVASAFKYLSKLIELILTMPFKLPSSNGDVSKFEKISNFAYTTTDLSTTGDISVLHLESDLLLDAKKNVRFYDEIITRLCEVDKSMQLIH